MIDVMKMSLPKMLAVVVAAGCGAAELKVRSVGTVVSNNTGRWIGDAFVNRVWAGAADAYGGEGNRVEGLPAPADSDRDAVPKPRGIVSGRLDFKTTRAPQIRPAVEPPFRSQARSNPEKR